MWKNMMKMKKALLVAIICFISAIVFYWSHDQEFIEDDPFDSHYKQKHWLKTQTNRRQQQKQHQQKQHQQQQKQKQQQQHHSNKRKGSAAKIKTVKQNALETFLVLSKEEYWSLRPLPCSHSLPGF
jgi:glucan phosphoethanolaminetransferase (alkaline phosphatase superfamily)